MCNNIFQELDGEFLIFTSTFVVVTTYSGGDAVDQTMISEAAGFLNDSLYIIKDGETEQPLSVQLMVSDFGATEGRTTW